VLPPRPSWLKLGSRVEFDSDDKSLTGRVVYLKYAAPPGTGTEQDWLSEAAEQEWKLSGEVIGGFDLLIHTPDHARRYYTESWITNLRPSPQAE
jgi:hypothetical protein